MGMTTIRQISQRMLKGVVIILVVAMAAGFFFMAPKFNNQSSDGLYHGPSVKVNGIKLKDKDYQAVLNQVATQAGEMQSQYGITTGMEEMREQALKSSIGNLVIQSLIKKNKIKITNSDVDKFFNKWSKQFPTKEERYSFYQQYNISGDAAFKQEIRNYLGEQGLYLALAKKKEIKLSVGKQEIADSYATINSSHILIATSKDITGALSDANAVKKANDVYNELKAGGDWTKLAKKYSMDTGSKEQGGSLGSMPLANFKQQMDKDFVAAALKQKLGEIGTPVKTQFGYHIIKVVERQDASGADFESQVEKIRGEIAYQKFRSDSEQYSKWLDARINEAEVTYLDPAFRAFQLRAEEKWADAAKFYERAVKMRQHKNDRDIILSALAVFAKQKDWNKVIKYGRSALKTYTNDYEMNCEVGQALCKRNKGKDKTDGLAMLKQSLTLAGEDTQALTTVESYYTALKLTKDANAIKAKIEKITAAQLKAEQEQQAVYEAEQKKAAEEAKKK